MENEKYKFRVEVSFQVDIIAEDQGEAEREAYDAMLRGEYNIGPNGERVGEIHTQVWEVLELDEDDLS